LEGSLTAGVEGGADNGPGVARIAGGSHGGTQFSIGIGDSLTCGDDATEVDCVSHVNARWVEAVNPSVNIVPNNSAHKYHLNKS
jgi:hypothetical protein